MKISYDSEIDALYIRLVSGKQECRTLKLNDDIALNIGSNEKLVGIEVLDASRVLGHGKRPSLEIENLVITELVGRTAKALGAHNALTEPSPHYGATARRSTKSRTPRKASARSSH